MIAEKSDLLEFFVFLLKRIKWKLHYKHEVK
jgi:hypothetical protein